MTENHWKVCERRTYGRTTLHVGACEVLTASVREFSLLHHLYTHYICLFHALSLIDCLVDDVFELFEVLGCLWGRNRHFYFVFYYLFNHLNSPDLLHGYLTHRLSVIFMWFMFWRERYFIYHTLNLGVEYRNIINNSV